MAPPAEPPRSPSDSLLGASADWDRLERPRRIDLACRMRAEGLSLREIAAVLPVSRSTLSVWCREVTLSGEQRRSILARTRPVRRDTQWRRRAEIEHIESRARIAGRRLLTNPLFTAGVALYWAEGSKTQRRLGVANADARLLTLFITWVRAFHDSDARFVGALNLHADNDIDAAHRYWREQLPVSRLPFTKPYIKPDGTGHRRNHLPFGVCRLRMRESTDAFLRTMAWIETMALEWQPSIATLPPGR